MVKLPHSFIPSDFISLEFCSLARAKVLYFTTIIFRICENSSPEDVF